MPTNISDVEPALETRRSRSAARRAAELNSDEFEPLRNPKTRRTLAFALIGTIILTGLTIALSTVMPDVLFYIMIAVITLAMMWCLGALKAANNGIEELSESVLDERQLAIRNKAYLLGYKILGFSTAVAISAMFVLNLTEFSVPGALVGGILVMLWQAIFAIPAIAVAFTLRD